MAKSPRMTALAFRLLGSRPSSEVSGWIAAISITVFGGLLRFWHLDRPHRLVFDETYYVKQGVSMLRYGYERRWDGNATPKPDDLFASGNTNIFQSTADFVVHPPAGKWMIAIGEWIFGPGSSFGWRFASAVCGTLSILMLIRIGRRLFGSTLLGLTAGLLLAVDTHHIVHSRTGLLDIFVMFWALAAFGALLLDRDQARRRLADRIESARALTPGTAPLSILRWGPGLGMRWWRLAAGIALGLCTATKWSGLYFVAVFGLMTVLWDVSARRASGTRHWFTLAIVRDGIPAGLVILPAMLGTYVASWTGWFLSKDGYDRTWGAQNPSQTFGWVPDGLRSLWKYHQDAYSFHVNLETFHPYMSNPWSWSVMGRPTAFYWSDPGKGVDGCTVDRCASAITAIANPVVWWGGTLALAIVLVRWALMRDWRAGAIFAGITAGYLPWFLFQDRTIYSFYAVAFEPWLVLGLAYALGLLLGSEPASPSRRLSGVITAGAVVIAAMVLGAWFYPIGTAEVIPYSEWSLRMWMPSWV